jgi:3-hydroxy-3-methylglutaryl CoA synthase
LAKKTIAESYGEKAGSGEKAVANHDEDSLSMAVEACMDALDEKDLARIGALFFATTTPPYREKQSAAIIAAALDLRRDIRVADVTDSTRAGSSAFLSAMDAVLGGLESAVVTAADCRIGAAQGAFEKLLGDGAAAFVFGKDNLIATVEATYSVTRDITDQWRSSSDQFVRTWEERFGIQAGYNQLVSEAVKGLLEKAGLQPAGINKLVLAGPQERYQKALAMSLGFSLGQVQLGQEETIGNTGAAQGPLMLAEALESANPGDTILFVTYGSGSDAILLKATEGIRERHPRMGFNKLLQSKRTNIAYTTYLKWNNMLPMEPGRRPEIPRPSAPAMWRNQQQALSGYGSRCTACGTPYFPQQLVCVECGEANRMEPYRFVGKNARIVTYTSDYLTVSPDPPATFVVIDFEGGGRMITELVDYHLDKLSVGMEVEMTFRHLYEAGNIHNYTWKVRPKR